MPFSFLLCGIFIAPNLNTAVVWKSWRFSLINIPRGSVHCGFSQRFPGDTGVVRLFMCFCCCFVLCAFSLIKCFQVKSSSIFRTGIGLYEFDFVRYGRCKFSARCLCVCCMCDLPLYLAKKISLLPLAKIFIKLVADEKGGMERQFPHCVPTGG